MLCDDRRILTLPKSLPWQLRQASSVCLVSIRENARGMVVFPAARLDMRLAGTVAALAAGALRRFIGGAMLL